MKELKLTISDDMWQEFKEAVEGHEIAGVTAECDYEVLAVYHMYQAIDRRIKDRKHPETGLSKQEMVHFRRGETGARMWLHSNKEATRKDFEVAGKMGIRRSRSEHVREMLLKGWMSAWKED